MAIAVIIVREHPAYNALSFHRNVAQVLLESAGELRVANLWRRLRRC
jgi:hypothetical protein